MTKTEPEIGWDREAERAVLGACLRDNPVIDEIALRLREGDFYPDAHRKIWSAIQDLRTRAHPVDLVTLADELLRRDHIADVGGYPYLADLWDSTPTAAHGEYYADIVRDRSLARNIAHIGREIVRDATDRAQPAVEILEAAEQKLFALGMVKALGDSEPLSTAIGEAFDRFDRRYEGIAEAGVPTGFVDLDHRLAGLHDGELVILAARPSVGKTALGLQIARNAAVEGTPVLFVSLEQPRIDLAERLLCAEASVDGHLLRTGKINDGEARRLQAAGQKLGAAKLFIDHHVAQVGRIVANARRHRLKHRIGLLVIDYLGLIEPDNQRINRSEQIATMTRRLKLLARELQIPVLLLAQLNREVENRSGGQPRLSDLRESGSQEQDADVVLLMHRVSDTMGPTVDIEVNVAKQRNGPTGPVTLTYVKPFMRFENFAPVPGEIPA